MPCLPSMPRAFRGVMLRMGDQHGEAAPPGAEVLENPTMKSDLELLDRRAVCAVFGGIHPATLYRHVRTGLVPRPIKVGSLSRWLRHECEAALAAMVAGRAS